ncbi:hypothetical protein KIN20_003131 [Parelaphostrongylus tenuis]|uniref:Uncharacterized protein n=1 Tax=Parelaphostrongylus tenuis TaxID=148309 RepID=A0AAD5MHV0_PARTN|nr:hypothetical protein KIN20_003131 [Parelaphostrongylus tenuis]
MHSSDERGRGYPWEGEDDQVCSLLMDGYNHMHVQQPDVNDKENHTAQYEKK